MAQQAARERRPEAGHKKRTPLKIELCLEMLIQADREGRFVMSFDAMREYGDTCLHSSIAALRDKGIRFTQMSYSHEHRHGGKAHFQQYRLAPDSRQKARALLMEYQALTGQKGAA
ncbi:MAG: hypothetical protein WD942_00175 [Dehalococcoidia bacterium]